MLWQQKQSQNNNILKEGQSILTTLYIPDEDCINDDTMTIMTNSDSCELTISSLNSDLHFGDWICEGEDLMGKAQAVITVGKIEPAKLEFEVYYGDLFLGILLSFVYF